MNFADELVNRAMEYAVECSKSVYGAGFQPFPILDSLFLGLHPRLV